MSNMSYKSYRSYKPKKRLGQNFLKNTLYAENLLGAAQIKKTDTVIEVGAGLGAITVGLAKLAKKVIAVEKDPSLIPILREQTKNFDNIKIVQGDILKIKTPPKRDQVPLFETEKGGPGPPLVKTNYKVVGNIPYYLTAPLIRKFLESENPPEVIVFMVQKEMAQRITAKPPNMSILAVSVQVYATPEIISYVPRSAFRPEPRVDSAIIKIKPHKNYQLPITNYQLLFKVVKAGFSSPRKQLVNNLSSGLKLNREAVMALLESAGIEPKRRAETLSVEEWLKLNEKL